MTIEFHDGLLIFRTIFPVFLLDNQLGSTDLVGFQVLAIQIHLQTRTESQCQRVSSGKCTKCICATNIDGSAVISLERLDGNLLYWRVERRQTVEPQWRIGNRTVEVQRSCPYVSITGIGHVLFGVCQNAVTLFDHTGTATETATL